MHDDDWDLSAWDEPRNPEPDTDSDDARWDWHESPTPAERNR